VVTDSARARFFVHRKGSAKLVPARNADMVGLDSRRHARDLKSDKPGRSFSSARSGVRHALEPPHDYRKLEKHKFVASVVSTLGEARERKEFDRLIVVAPRRTLGELRSLMPQQVRDCLFQEVAKDLSNEPESRLWSRLAALGVRPTALSAPVRGKAGEG
jgi:protein required for attachment to host cells